nr:cytochrome b561, DM13 and DOMON domain-containing protein At5g54830 [Tanacetum cinerariifolium]
MTADFSHVMLSNLGDGGSRNSSVNVSGVVDEQPTMFENCKVLSGTYRLRWTLNEKDSVVDIGLEGATGIQNYMYSECIKNGDGMVEGVCPDTMYNVSIPNDLVNNTKSEFAFLNPPNPSKVLYINKKESPVLRVERGVPVQFSIQASHDVAFYITSDPLGSNATLGNVTETIYTNGPDAQEIVGCEVTSVSAMTSHVDTTLPQQNTVFNLDFNMKGKNEESYKFTNVVQKEFGNMKWNLIEEMAHIGFTRSNGEISF